ncbi:MAG: hypothetical protein AB7O47_02010 [Flavobacteriales bacterium]
MKKKQTSFKISISEIKNKKPNDFAKNAIIYVYSLKFVKLKYIIFLRKSEALNYKSSLILDGETRKELMFPGEEKWFYPKVIDDFLSKK